MSKTIQVGLIGYGMAGQVFHAPMITSISGIQLSKIRETKPDYIVILPWNLKNEIMEQMRDIRSWGGQFVVLMPTTQVFP